MGTIWTKKGMRQGVESEKEEKTRKRRRKQGGGERIMREIVDKWERL